jgi:hypothetical protein
MEDAHKYGFPWSSSTARNISMVGAWDGIGEALVAPRLDFEAAANIVGLGVWSMLSLELESRAVIGR